MIMIVDILKTSFPSVRTLKLDGNPFISPDLQKAIAEGQLRLGSVGSSEPTEVNIPLVWSEEDDDQPENRRISLVAALITNGMLSHDDVVVQMLGTGKAIASREQRYELRFVGPYRAMLSTVIAFLK